MDQLHFNDLLEEEVMIAASESCGPNSPEYTRLCERLRDDIRFAQEVAQRHGVQLDPFGDVVDVEGASDPAAAGV